MKSSSSELGLYSHYYHDIDLVLRRVEICKRCLLLLGSLAAKVILKQLNWDFCRSYFVSLTQTARDQMNRTLHWKNAEILFISSRILFSRNLF